MCSPFGILLPSHLLWACWQVEKPSICLALVCVHIKVLPRSGAVSLVELNLWFRSALSPWRVVWARGNSSKIASGMFYIAWVILSIGWDIFKFAEGQGAVSLPPPFFMYYFVKNEKFEWREQEVLVQQPNPQQEIYWVANLWPSNWLRKNWNVSKYPPEINGDCLYFGPGADWNWDNKWECLIPKEWELAALHRLSFWGRTNNQGLRFPLQQGLGRLNMCQISPCFAFYILKRSWIFLCPCSQTLIKVLPRKL